MAFAMHLKLRFRLFLVDDNDCCSFVEIVTCERVEVGLQCVTKLWTI